MRKAVQQDAGLVLDAEIRRTPGHRQAPGPQPVLGRLQQHPRRGGIVDAFEETEEPRAVTVRLQVPRVVEGRNPAHGFVAPVKQQEFARRVPEEITAARIDLLAHVGVERRHPGRQVMVKPLRQVQEGLPLPAAAHRHDPPRLTHARTGGRTARISARASAVVRSCASV